MASEPTTPVRVPKAASTYSPTTQDPDLRSQINARLLSDGHVTKIQEQLLHALHASPTNWPTLIQNHALSLLRSGEIHTFPELMSRVLDDIRADSAAARKAESESARMNSGGGGTIGSGKGRTALSNGVAAREEVNGRKAGEVGRIKGRGEGGQSLALPRNVVEEGVRITRECLEAVVEVIE